MRRDWGNIVESRLFEMGKSPVLYTSLLIIIVLCVERVVYSSFLLDLRTYFYTSFLIFLPLLIRVFYTHFIKLNNNNYLFNVNFNSSRRKLL
jgi:hypothetical protein